MALRRSLLMNMKGESSLWKSIQVTLQSAVTNGAEAKTIAESIVPTESKVAFICRDNLDESAYINNQLIEVTVINGTALAAIRYRSNGYQQGTTGYFTSSYDFKASIGDTYTIFYQ